MKKTACGICGLLASLVATGADVRELTDFKITGGLKSVGKVSFAFTCDNPNAICRTFVYFTSGKGCYVVPFRLAAAGRSVIEVNRNACIREEGAVSGWGAVTAARVSFYRDDAKPLEWSVGDFKPLPAPYDAVVATAGACAHGFPALLEQCGLDVLFIGADELDESVLAPASLVAPIGAKGRAFSPAFNATLKAFRARGGAVLPIAERLSAGDDIPKLLALVERLQPRLKPKTDAGRARLARLDAANRAAAREFPALMKAGGPDELRVLYCHAAYGAENVTDVAKWEDWDRTCAWMKNLGFNGLCVNVARGGIAFYDSKVLPVAPEVAAKGDSVELIKRACAKHGIKFIAWKVCFRSRKGMKTPAFERWIAEDGRGAVAYDGKRDDEWLCPNHPLNRQLEIDAVVELAKRRPWAVGLDYIRYPSPDWCFCGNCRAAFEKTLGHAVTNWPHAVRRNAELGERWEAFRRATITGVVRDISRRVRAEAPGVTLRAAVFGLPSNARTVAQDWPAWCEEGLLDMVGPMSGADSVARLNAKLDAQRGCSHALPSCPTIYPSTWRDPTMGAQDLLPLIRALRARHVPGFAIFTLNGRFIRMVDPDN